MEYLFLELLLFHEVAHFVLFDAAEDINLHPFAALFEDGFYLVEVERPRVGCLEVNDNLLNLPISDPIHEEVSFSVAYPLEALEDAWLLVRVEDLVQWLEPLLKRVIEVGNEEHHQVRQELHELDGCVAIAH